RGRVGQRELGPQHDRRVEVHERRRVEAAAEPAAARGLALGHDRRAVRRALAREGLRDAIGRVGLVEVVDRMREPARVEAVLDLLGIEAVRRAAQPVAAARLGLDPVAARAQRLDVLPDLCARDPVLVGQRFTRAGPVAGAAQRIEHAHRPRAHLRALPCRGPPSLASGSLRVGLRPPCPRVSSSATSAAGAEWVRAPIEIRCTPVSATARTLARLTPPLASSSAWPRSRDAIRASTSREQLSSSRKSAPASTAACASSSDSTSTCTRRPAGAAASAAFTAGTTPPANATWLSLSRM